MTTKETDPFLMLDELPVTNYRPGEFPGAPWHPHRGMDTVMYFKRGEGSHEDSMGNKGTLRAGDCQWMTAASGVDVAAVRAHGLLMWVFITMVMCAITGQYALFALYSYLHTIDVALAGERVIEKMHRHYDTRDRRTFGSSELSAEVSRGGDYARYDLDELLEDVAATCDATQASLTRSSDAWSSILIHFLLVAFAQTFVVLNHVTLHTVGELKHTPYGYCYYFQDAFFVGSAGLVIFSTVVFAASVTSKCREVRGEAKRIAYANDAHVHAAALSQVLEDHLVGMSCFGHPVDQQKVAMILFAYTMLVLNSVIAILARRYNVGSPRRALAP